MDHSIVFYQACIKHLLTTYEELCTDDSTVELLFDDERSHYMVIRVGWYQHKRIHSCLVHIDICQDKIIIQANNTEDMIDDELIEMGIPRDKIGLGFLPPDVQEYLSHERETRQHLFQSMLETHQDGMFQPIAQCA